MRSLALLPVSLALASLHLGTQGGAAGPATAAGGEVDLIGAGIEAARPTAAEERWRAIPWHTSASAAIAVARQTGKPMFFFGVDGILDTGYC